MLAKLRIRTAKGEEIKLNNVERIQLGEINDGIINIKENIIVISSEKGVMKFDLKDITSIAFNICGDKRVLSVSSVISTKAVN